MGVSVILFIRYGEVIQVIIAYTEILLNSLMRTHLALYGVDENISRFEPNQTQNGYCVVGLSLSKLGILE